MDFRKKRKKILKDLKFFLLKYLLMPLMVFIMRIWAKTWRFEWENLDNLKQVIKSMKTGMITAFWHGDMIGIFGAGMADKWDVPISILISPSRDGDILARMVMKFGYKTERGSSSKNPVASLKLLKNVLDKNEIVAIAVDGPRGPRNVAKPGAILLSKIAGCPIIPAAIRASRKIRFNSWDKAELPLPFAKVKVCFGSEFLVPSDADKNVIGENRDKLEKILLEIKFKNSIN